MEQDPLAKEDCLKILISRKWKSADSSRFAAAAGYAFFEDKYFDAFGLAKFFSEKADLNFEQFVSLVKNLNGNFAIIAAFGRELFASVDRVRSHPIFYCLKGNKLYIGDDLKTMKGIAGIVNVNSDSAQEYLMSGYVSGNNTLYHEINGLQAGESFQTVFGEKGLCEKVATKRYYVYRNRNKAKPVLDPMVKCHDEVLRKAFERVIKSVNGRKVVIPLSGGVDSRLVASMFRELNYKNVLCVSYGTPGNWEASISREAAKKLGHEWFFVPYTRKKWRDAARASEWRKFFYSFDNIVSLPNISEWLAVSELKKNNVIPVDSIFIPGHTGDFISGGHIHYVFDEKTGNITMKSLLERILEKHYALWPRILKNPEVRKIVCEHIAVLLDTCESNDTQSLIDAYECWEWQERQAKFIINAARTYEFWGYEWRIPLWDSEIMNFWSTVPYAFKLRKYLYLTCLETTDTLNVFGSNLRRDKLYRKRILPNAARSFLEYFRDTKAIYGIYGCLDSVLLNAGKRNINSMLVKDYLQWARS